MGQGAAPNQHAKDHSPAIDQTEFDLTLDRADADLDGDEDPLFLLSARSSNLATSGDAGFDCHPAIALVSAEADIEAHASRAELADVLDVQRAAARTGVDFCPQTQDAPRGDVDVFGHADNQRYGCAASHAP